MKSKFILNLFLTAALLTGGSACRESAGVRPANSSNAGSGVPVAITTPAGADPVNHNSTDANLKNSNTTAVEPEMPLIEDDLADTMNIKSSPNAARQPFDLQFIDTMTQHHQAAIVMAKMVLSNSENRDLRNFAEQVIDDQVRDIEQMETFREQWFAAEPEAINLELPGMGETMKLMMGERMDRMEAASGHEFDIQFLEMMSTHHAGAIAMSKTATEKAEHPELKTLAQVILQKQEKEIKQMQSWKEIWSKKSGT
jgi:uncharacterized protein (DUF305 family)